MVLSAVVKYLGTDMSVLVRFAEDAKVKGAVSKVWDVVQGGLCDLD